LLHATLRPLDYFRIVSQYAFFVGAIFLPANCKLGLWGTYFAYFIGANTPRHRVIDDFSEAWFLTDTVPSSG